MSRTNGALLAFRAATPSREGRRALSAGSVQRVSPAKRKTRAGVSCRLPRPLHAMTTPVRVFISYARRDEVHRRELDNHLKHLEREGVIEAWSDGLIEPGQEWEASIRERLASAQIVVLVVSAEFLGSEWCAHEMAGALERHDAGEARVIPVLLGPCLWKRSPLAKLQMVPKNAVPAVTLAHRDEAWGEAAEAIADAAEQIASGAVKPPWASAAGKDGFGKWAELSVGGVVQRFRWIPPGTGWLGSPEAEAGRWDDEGPRHRVTWTRGYWLGDTPVTQALWERVMGSNPSRFKTPNRPAERVSWEDCQGFIQALNQRSPLLAARLPSEAEWEYACRAGTSTATWLGDLEIVGERNAPLLDAIAWYGGNCGVGFELNNGYDLTKWKERHHADSPGGSHPVAQKAANPWGLYDMLGNVLQLPPGQGNAMPARRDGQSHRRHGQACHGVSVVPRSDEDGRGQS